LIEEGLITPPTEPKGTIDVESLPRPKDGTTLTEILLEQRRSGS
jgi:hypothetical protein